MHAVRSYRYFDVVMVAFVVVLLCSNLIGPAKIAVIELPVWGPFVFGAGAIFFPISYVFGDILTEVYGYAQARKVIWAGFAALLFASVMAAVVLALPPAPFWQHQQAFEVAFGNTWRIVLASIAGYFCGEFVNAYVLAKMKVWTAGRALWSRTIGSTVVGQALDSSIFCTIAFYGLMPNEVLVSLVVFQWLFKVTYETAATPLTYLVVNYLKRKEGVDVYDRDTKFTPFALTE